MRELILTVVVFGASLLVLTLIAAIGHGLWIAAAGLIRIVFGIGVEKSSSPIRCPRCGRSLARTDRWCSACQWGHSPAADSASITQDLQAAARQLERFRHDRTISDPAYQAVLRAIEAEQWRLSLAKRPATTAAAEPILLSQPPESQPSEVIGASIPPIPQGGSITPAPIPLESASGPIETASLAPPMARPVDEQAEVLIPPPRIPTPLDQSAELAPPAPRRPLSEILAAFMEQRNIRWGELVGGLLIIGCSIALVISLWATITSVPILKYFLFTAVISALFGVGMYTEHRWKLPMTSHAVLIIATLLVPLNFLAIAAFSQGMQSWDVQRLASELVALGAFFYLVQRSGRIVVPEWSWALTAGVLGPAVAQLLIRRFVTGETGSGVVFGMGLFPLLCYGGSIAAMLRTVRRWERVGESESNAVFILLGSVSFAALLALGLLVYSTGRPTEAMRDLAPLLSLFGVPALGSGLALWRRVTDERLTLIRIAATSIAVAGTMILLSGIGFAWPRPAILLTVAFLDFVALTAIALQFELPAAHFLATPCLVFGYLVGLHLALQRIQWSATTSEMLHAILSATSGNGLVPMVAILGAASQLWRRIGRSTDQRIYQVAAGTIAVVSLGLVSAFGFGRVGDPHGATIVYAIFAAAAFIAARQVRRWQATVAGSVLTLAALVQGIVFRIAGHSAPTYWQFAMLVHATASVLVAGSLRATLPGWRKHFADPLSFAGLGSSLLAIPFWLYAMPSETTAMIAVSTIWLAGIWLAVSYLHRLAGLFTAAQFMTAISVVLAVSAYAQDTDWYVTAAHPLWDPWFLQLQGIALAALCLSWVGVRIGLNFWCSRFDAAGTSATPDNQTTVETIQWLLNPPWPPMDRIVTGLVLLGFLLMSATGVVPGIVHEMAPRSGLNPDFITVFGDSYTHIFGGQSWLLCALLVAVLIAAMWEHFDQWLIYGTMVTIACACPLIAGLWDSDVATASALRWLLGGYLMAASLPIWCRSYAADWWRRFSRTETLDRLESLARESRIVLFTIAIAPILALTIYPALATIVGTPPVGVAAASVFGRMGDSISYVIPLLVVIGVLAGHAMRERSAVMAFSGGLVLNLAVSLGYLLHVVTTSGGAIDAVALVRLLQLNAIATAGFAIAWWGVRTWWLRRAGAVDVGVAGGLIRTQVAFGLALNVLLIIPGDFWLFLSPASIATSIAERGSILGGIALVVALGARWWIVEYSAFCRNLSPSESDSNSPAPMRLGETLPHKSLEPHPSPHPSPLAARGEGGRRPGEGRPVNCEAKRLGEELRVSVGLVCATIIGIGSLLAFALCPLEAGFLGSGAMLMKLTRAPVPWLGFHVLMLSRVVAGWIFLRMAWVWRQGLPLRLAEAGSGWPKAVERWTVTAALLGTVFALRDMLGGTDPDAPWWSVAAFVALSVLMAAQARWTLRRGYIYWAGIFGNLAATSWCLEELWPRTGHIFDTIHVNVIALTLPAIAWLALDVQVFRRDRSSAASGRLPAFHRVAAVLALGILMTDVAIGLVADASGNPLKGPMESLGWAALASLAAIVVACLWDVQARYAVPSLYVLGLVGAGMAIDRFDLSTRWLGWTGVISLAAYSIATSYLWSIRTGLGTVMDRLRIPRRVESQSGGHSWLLAVNQLVAAAVVVLAYWIVLTFDTQSVGGGAGIALTLRISAAKAAMSQALAIGLLAYGARRSQLQKVALLVVAIGGVAWGWAWLNPLTAGNLLNRAVVVLTVLAAVTVLYGIGLTKILRRENDWTRGAQELMPWLAGLCAISLAVILSVEVADQVRIGRVEMAGLAIVVVSVALVALTAAGLVLAVVPGRDPFQLSVRGRMTYVYASEGLLGLLFMHIRLTKPEWFGGLFEQFWPLIVLAVAYLGVGLSELFQRQHRLVLAEPLQRTGSLLPVLPVLGFWAIPSHTHYSLVLIVVGLLYGALSVTRKSFGFGVLASLAANGGLMYLLNHNFGFGWFEHAQVWLIPGALCVLAAAYMNRERLSREQFISIRYVAVMLIYVASTSDIFLSGVRAAPWLPLILALLSVAGIMSGIWLRVRAFLFLGAGFLVLSLITMILSAQVNLGWTWLWWVAGISLGVAIITLFALFEKKRNEMLQMVEGLKRWET